MKSEDIFTTIEDELKKLLRDEQLNHPELREKYPQLNLGLSTNCYQSRDNNIIFTVCGEPEKDMDDDDIIRLYMRKEDEILILIEIILPIPRQGTGTKICNLLINLAKENNLKQFRIHRVGDTSLPLCRSLKMIQDSDTDDYYLNL